MPNVLTKYLTRVNTDGNQRVTNTDVLNTMDGEILERE